MNAVITRGRCSVCTYRVRLRRDGMVQSHRLWAGETHLDPCAGSGTPPILRDGRPLCDDGSVCVRCGSGFPNCVDRRPDGERYDHEQTCGRYWRDDDCSVCWICEREMAEEAE